MTEEIWKDVDGYEGLYKISTYGRLWSVRKNKEMNYSPDSYGYMRTCLYREGMKQHTSIHRLVAENFIDNPQNKPHVNHIDENCRNNNLDNLEWTTVKENMNHGTRNERMAKSKWKRVDRYSLDGELIDSFQSINEAKEHFGYADHSGISDCCRGKIKSSRGYIWKYA